jgi:hypothetical protein
MQADRIEKFQIERKYLGVHEFKPEYRGDCFTADFDGSHPKSIERNIETHKIRIEEELKDHENSMV